MMQNISFKKLLLIGFGILFLSIPAMVLVSEKMDQPKNGKTAVSLFDADVETRGDKISREIEERRKRDWPKKCVPDGGLSLVEQANYKFQNAEDYDKDMEFGANQMKVFGLLKNSSTNCYATKVQMEIMLVNDSGEVFQKESYAYLPSIIDYDSAKAVEALGGSLGESKPIDRGFADLTISPGSVKEFSEIIKVYESLTVGMGEKLKPGIKPQLKIISTEWISR